MTGALSNKTINKIQDLIEYEFVDHDLLRTALTHPSAVAEGARGQHYERFEFLGDRVLGLTAAESLIERYPDANEGGLAKRLNFLVSRDACSETAENLKLSEFLILGASEKQSAGKRKSAILGNVCEALIAAIYLDGGLEAARAFFERNWGERLHQLDTAPKDAKTALQEWAQAQGFEIPRYETIERTGPDHRPTFVVSVRINNGAPETGAGSNKKEAEHKAAEQMLVREGVWTTEKV